MSGTVGGFAGCNNYSGSYSVSGSTITFGALVVTAKACGDVATTVESIYLGSLAQMTTWQVSSDGSTLTLSTAPGAPVLTFSAPLR